MPGLPRLSHGGSPGHRKRTNMGKERHRHDLVNHRP
jgi:hypothetical protein